MGKQMKQRTKRGKSAARKVFEKLEAKVMAAVGRRAVKIKVRGVKAVAKKAAKRALIAGGVAAAGVVVKEIQSRRRRGKPA